MGIITAYPDDSATTDSDKFLTSDSTGATKLTAASTIKSYVLATSNVGTSAIADSSVTSEKLKSTVAFFAYLGASQTTSSSTFKINIGTEVYDEGNNFNTTLYRFVAPVAGVYHFDATISANNASTMRLTPSFFKNGAQLTTGTTSDTTFVTNEVHTDVKLAVNDYIELFAGANGAVGLNFGSTPFYTYMSGHLIGRV